MSEKQQADAEYFAGIEARKQAIAKQVAESPIQNVLGLIDGSSNGGWQESDGQWTLCLTFHDWKIPPGPLKKMPLSVRVTSSRKKFDALMNRIESYTVVRITARVAEETVIGTSQAQVLEFHGVDSSDPELNEVAVELQKPVVHQDAQFGLFTLDRTVNWYNAETTWNGEAVKLNLEPDESGKIDTVLGIARELWRGQKDWAKRIQDYAVQELLPLKNESWLEEDEAELTPKQFKAKMTLEAINLDSEGSFVFWHNDGDLFWGHSIQISGTLSEGPTDADIPG